MRSQLAGTHILKRWQTEPDGQRSISISSAIAPHSGWTSSIAAMAAVLPALLALGLLEPLASAAAVGHYGPDLTPHVSVL